MINNLPVSGSLRTRLALTLIGGAAILAILLFFVIRSFATQVAQAGQDNVLGASIASILDVAAIRNGNVQIDIPYASFSMLSTPSDDRIFYAIYQDATFLSGYPDLSSKRESAEGQSNFSSVKYRGETIRLVSATRTLIGADEKIRIQIYLAQTQDSLSGTLEKISRSAAIFGVGFFALATLLSYWATSSTIGQLESLASSVTRRGPQDLSPFKKPVPSEMLPLVSSLNLLMGRLDHSLKQSEDFIAEAAHRVRTPLATVRSYAETTLQRVDKKENRDAMRSMVRAIDESSRAASQLLDHAMITFRADHLERSDIDFSELVKELVVRLTPIAEMKDVVINLQCDAGVRCSGDPILIQNAVRNLLDNALKYSPRESALDICVFKDPKATVKICDNGEGFPMEEMDSLAARFARGQNSKGTIGSGLGLTIAKDVAIAHGGDLRLSNRPEGGACVTFSL